MRLTQSKQEAARKNDFSGVVVWLVPARDTAAALTRKHAEMIQKDKTFSPHVLAIQTGTFVDFPNFDPIFHNAFSNFDGQIFDVGLYPPGSSRSIRFTRPGIVKVFCNIHPSMAATIVVVDTDHFTVTNRSGDYSIANVPPGTYRIHFFHERATSDTLAGLTQTIVVGTEPSERPPTTISEAGYLPLAHKNKYGREYPPDAGSSDFYSISIR